MNQDTVFAVINGFIAVDYLLIAAFFIWKLVGVFQLRGHNPMSVITLICAVIFLLGNAQTHIVLFTWSLDDQLKAQWYSWWNVSLHLIQAIAGLVFTVLSYRSLVVRIYDKRHYEATTKRVTRKPAPARPPLRGKHQADG